MDGHLVAISHFHILEWSAHALYQIDMLTRINTQRSV